jgi:tetratricopeptide (TPR) repeat protein
LAGSTEAELQLKLQEARASGDVEGQANVLFTLAGLARERGDRAAAVELYQQSGMLWQQLKKEANLLATLNNLAPLLADIEQYDQAYNSARAAADLAQKSRDPGAMAMAVGTLGMVANSAGDQESARTAYFKSLEFAQAARDPLRIARAQYNLGWVAFISGDYAETRLRTVDAANALDGTVDVTLQPSISMLAGRLDIRQRAYDRAMARLGWAARTFNYAGRDEEAALASFGFGAAEYLGGQRPQGRAQQDEGRRRIEATFAGIRLTRNRRATARRLIGLSRLAAAAGDTEAATAFGQLAANIGSHLSDMALQSMARQLLSGGAYAGAADPGIAAATGELDVAGAPGETPEPAGAGDGPDLEWLEHDLGVPPLAPPPSPPPDGPPNAEYVGRIRILDLTAEGRGYAILEDVAGRIGVSNNHDAEAGLLAVLRRRDPMLLRRLDFDSEAGGVGIRAAGHEDIRTAAVWLASMFRQ